ncbi:unnamed protein product [Sphenostylis stenocarpa]|uniref:Uncharacterized protein n=1 Tax=Sphenostylis stenocarpa TaxID=92480 RepID=A0AA86VSE7_9FABA|nr:unnamed protein product [Sphenostylis stenocarpa]
MEFGRSDHGFTNRDGFQEKFHICNTLIDISTGKHCSTQLENTIRKVKMAAITTGNTMSKGSPGGVGAPMTNGPNRRMATMIINITTEP